MCQGVFQDDRNSLWRHLLFWSMCEHYTFAGWLLLPWKESWKESNVSCLTDGTSTLSGEEGWVLRKGAAAVLVDSVSGFTCLPCWRPSKLNSWYLSLLGLYIVHWHPDLINFPKSGNFQDFNPFESRCFLSKSLRYSNMRIWVWGKSRIISNCVTARNTDLTPNGNGLSLRLNAELEVSASLAISIHQWWFLRQILESRFGRLMICLKSQRLHEQSIQHRSVTRWIYSINGPWKLGTRELEDRRNFG